MPKSTVATSVPGRRPTSVAMPGFFLAGRRILDPLLFGLLPLAFAALVMYAEARQGLLGFDFKGTIWQPGREILAGHSPYPPPLAAAMDSGNPSVYPPVVLLLALPYALLPFTIAYAAWTATLVAAVLVALRILGARDWRCYTIALGSLPVAYGLALGNLVVLLVPLLACAWRYRASPRWSGLAVGAGIALKLVLWPLLVWFIVTRRWRAAFMAAASAVVSMVCAWAILGFDGLRDYPQLLRVNNDLYAAHSWSLLAGGVGLGLPWSVASTLASLAGVALLALAFVSIRRRNGDRIAFCVVVVASIACLPIVWPASLILLLVPIVLVAPSADLIWILLTALWLGAAVPRQLADAGSPGTDAASIVWRMQHAGPPTAQIAVFTGLVALITVLVLRRAGRVRSADRGTSSLRVPRPDGGGLGPPPR